MTGKNCLLLFTRYPQPGQTKTRLIPALGPEGAAQLHQRLATHTMQQIRQLQAVHTEVWFTGAEVHQMQAWLGPEWHYQTQKGGDLGDRLSHAFEQAFASGFEAVLAIGTDCPGLEAAILHQTFELLTQTDLVLGPATDGGYYLIGLRRPTPYLFNGGIAWGSETVFQQTVEAAQALGLTIATLPPLTDIDRPADLALLHQWPALRENP